MKQKVMISTGSQAFEFEGEILELNEEYITLRAAKGDIFIERKYLVFIQFLNEERQPDPPKTIQQRDPKPVVVRNPKIDHAAKFLRQRLTQDPLEQKLEEKLVPPSQFPDDVEEELIRVHNSPDVDENMEVVKNVISSTFGNEHPLVKATNLKQAIKTAMENEDFSMNTGTVEYQDPLKTVLGLNNAGNKKTRSS